jgi:hypothetical protein
VREVTWFTLICWQPWVLQVSLIQASPAPASSKKSSGENVDVRKKHVTAVDFTTSGDIPVSKRITYRDHQMFTCHMRLLRRNNNNYRSLTWLMLCSKFRTRFLGYCLAEAVRLPIPLRLQTNNKFRMISFKSFSAPFLICVFSEKS